MNIEDLKRQIMENKPVAKITPNGDIELEINDNFNQILNGYYDEKKALVKKRAFQIAMLTALGFTSSIILSNIDNSLIDEIIISTNAFLISGSMYINDAIKQKKEAQTYKENLQKEFQKEAEERYQNNKYYQIENDGTILFDSPKGGKSK